MIAGVTPAALADASDSLISGLSLAVAVKKEQVTLLPFKQIARRHLLNDGSGWGEGGAAGAAHGRALLQSIYSSPSTAVPIILSMGNATTAPQRAASAADRLTSLAVGGAASPAAAITAALADAGVVGATVASVAKPQATIVLGVTLAVPPQVPPQETVQGLQEVVRDGRVMNALTRAGVPLENVLPGAITIVFPPPTPARPPPPLAPLLPTGARDSSSQHLWL